MLINDVGNILFNITFIVFFGFKYFFAAYEKPFEYAIVYMSSLIFGTISLLGSTETISLFPSPICETVVASYLNLDLHNSNNVAPLSVLMHKNASPIIADCNIGKPKLDCKRAFVTTISI